MQRISTAMLFSPHNKKPIREDGLLRFNLKDSSGRLNNQDCLPA